MTIRNFTITSIVAWLIIIGVSFVLPIPVLIWLFLALFQLIGVFAVMAKRKSTATTETTGSLSFGVSLLIAFISAVVYWFAQIFTVSAPFFRQDLGPGGNAGLEPMFLSFLLAIALFFIILSGLSTHQKNTRWFILGFVVISFAMMIWFTVSGHFYTTTGFG